MERRLIGHYRIVGPLGRGGMGEVYRAHDERLDRPVAIKAIRSEMLTDPQAKRRFLDEANRASKIVHPYVATVFDVVEEEGTPFLVMEYIEGRELSEVLQDKPTTAKLTRYLLEIAEGLEAIHQAGLVHRDLKPANIMIGEGGHAKVMDLGLAETTPLDDMTVAGERMTDLQTVTTDHSLRGTLAYMSPEQIRMQSLDQRSDLFALGIVLYEAITGEHPFRRDTMVETASAILNELPGRGKPSPEIAEAGALGKVAMQLLEKSPERRYANTRELILHLESLVEGTQTSVRAPLVLTRRRAALFALPILGLVALTVVLTWWAFQGPPGVSASRPAVAVLPFEDKTGEADADVQSAMIADVLAAHLGESSRLRSVPLQRVLEIFENAAATSSVSQRLEAVARGVEADWLLVGKLYRDAGDYLCTVVVYDGELGSERSYTVRAARATAVARLAAVRAEELITGRDMASLEQTESPLLVSESDEAQRLYQRAVQLEKELRYAEAVDLLESATERDPRFLRALLLLSDLLNRVGFERRARQQADQLARLVETTGLPATDRLFLEARAMRARIHSRDQDSYEASRALADRFPDEPGTHLELSSALVRLREFDSALDAVDGALKLDRLDPRVHLARAEILAGLGRRDEALEAIAEAERLFEFLGISRGSSSVALSRGDVLSRSGDYAAAADSFREARDLLSRNGLTVMAMKATTDEANMELLQWNLAEAETGYRQSLPAARETGHYSLVVRTLASLGGLQLRQRRLEEAESSLRQSLDEAIKLENAALQLTPMINLSGVLNLTQQLKEARSQASEAVALATARNDTRRVFLASLQLAEADRRDGRLEPAIRALEELARSEETGATPALRAYAWQNLVDAFEDAERPSDALTAASEAVRLTRDLGNPARLGYSFLLQARTLAVLGYIDEAARDLDEADELLAQAGPAPKLLDNARLSRARLAAVKNDWGTVLELSDVTNDERLSEFAPLMLLRAEALLELGRIAEAEKAARRARDHGWTAAADRVVGSVLVSLCLHQAGESDAAGEARRALEQAEAAGMPLSQARAAAVLYSRQADSGANRYRDVAERALQRYLESVSSDRRDWVRQRTDVWDVLPENRGGG